MKVRQFVLNEKMVDRLLVTGQLSGTVQFENGDVEHIRFVIDEQTEDMNVYYEQR